MRLANQVRTPSTLKVADDGREHVLHTYTSDKDLACVASLDALAFGDFISLDMDYLRTVVDHGVIFGEEDSDGQLISEAQLLLGRMPNAQERLPRTMSDSAAYLEGYATAPSARGRHLGRVLLKGARTVAQAHGKKEILATCRLENGASLATMLAQGYRGISFDHRYYETEVPELGARLILRQPLDELPADSMPEPEVSFVVHDTPQSQTHVYVVSALERGYEISSIGEASTENAFMLGLSRAS